MFVNLLVRLDKDFKKGIIPSFCDTEGDSDQVFCHIYNVIVGLTVRAENVLFLL